MRILLVLSYLFVSLLASSQNVTNIKLNPNQQKTGPLMLSDLAESVEYVPLEFTDKCIIGTEPIDYDVSENYIAAYCWKANQVFLFRRNGTFVCPVGRGGQGPGEYFQYSVTGVFIDELQKRVYVGTSTPNQLQCFDLKGKFIKAYAVIKESDQDNAFFLRHVNNQFLLSYTKTTGTAPHMYELRTPDMKLKASAVKTTSFSVNDVYLGFNVTSHYLFGGNAYVRETVFNDTLYQITDKNKFVPVYVIGAGKYSITPEMRSDVELYREYEKSTGIITYANIFETRSYLYIYYLFHRKHCFVYYSKSAKELYHFASDRGIPNDYDGGLAFCPTLQKENKWYAFYGASRIQEELSRQKKITPKALKVTVQAFERMVKKIDPEDNPVLMIVKMKE